MGDSCGDCDASFMHKFSHKKMPGTMITIYNYCDSNMLLLLSVTLHCNQNVILLFCLMWHNVYNNLNFLIKYNYEYKNL
jgi:hypothetical protein